MEYRYGHFSKQGDEFIITDPATPRPFDNFLWNDVCYSNVQQTGVGCFDYQVGDEEGIQLLTGVGRICDFDVFGRDHLMSRLIYVRDNETGEFWNVNWEPVRREPDQFTCTHGLGVTTIDTTVAGIRSVFGILVPRGSDPVELWSLRSVNTTDRPRRLSLFGYNQFQFKYKWGFDSYGDMVYRNSCYDPDLNAVVATKHPYRKPHDTLTGFFTADVPMAGWDGTRDAFVGLYNTLADPEAVRRGACSNTPGSADATIAAAQFDLDLAPGEERVIALLLGAAPASQQIADLRDRYLDRFGDCLTEVRDFHRQQSARNRITTPDAHFDRLQNHWIKQATSYGATWCRWGYKGYRDIVQHGLGVSTLRPERTREIILEALRRQYQSGLALRGWHPVDEKPYSDSALWNVFTLTAYLRETGDLALLHERVPFYDGGEDATVLDHIDRALDFLESNKGAHGLLLIKFGDWNDSLTGIGKEGRGESVWLSEAYAEAMREMAALAEVLGDTDKRRDYVARREHIVNAIRQHAWNGRWYTRCFDDNGRPIGSPESAEAKIFFEAQAWALIAGIAGPEEQQTLLDSVDEILLTDAGYLLLAPPFTRVDDNIGRISSMEPGVAENGTVYSHLNIWMILGLVRNGRADKAWDIYRRVAPGMLDEGEDDTNNLREFKQNCPPYMVANCYFGPDHRNNAFQMEFTWITGSVAWSNTVIVQEMLGAKADYNGLRIVPQLPSAWKECRVERHYRGAVYDIRIENPDGLQSGQVEITLDGNKVEGNLLPDLADGKTHEVRVVMRG